MANDHAPEPTERSTAPGQSPSDIDADLADDRLDPSPLTLDETVMADDFAAGTDAPLGRAGVERALANG